MDKGKDKMDKISGDSLDDFVNVKGETYKKPEVKDKEIFGSFDSSDEKLFDVARKKVPTSRSIEEKKIQEEVNKLLDAFNNESYSSGRMRANWRKEIREAEKNKIEKAKGKAKAGSRTKKKKKKPTKKKPSKKKPTKKKPSKKKPTQRKPSKKKPTKRKIGGAMPLPPALRRRAAPRVRSPPRSFTLLVLENNLVPVPRKIILDAHDMDELREGIAENLPAAAANSKNLTITLENGNVVQEDLENLNSKDRIFVKPLT